VTSDIFSVAAQTRADIEALIYEHAWLVDHHQSERLADLYVENGRLSGIGMNHVGRDAIARYGADRAKMTNRFARHLCNNLRLIPLGQDRVEGHVTITLYRHDGSGGLPEANAVADAHDVYIKGADGRWRFEERRLELIFESEAHRHPPAT
jgi:ketosteroid isomerase-like protein